MKGDKIVRVCDRHSNETVTPEKNVTKYKHVRKSMVEILCKSDSCGIKIDLLNSIPIAKLLIFSNFLRAVPLYDVINGIRLLMRPTVIIPAWCTLWSMNVKEITFYNSLVPSEWLVSPLSFTIKCRPPQSS